MPYHGSLVVTVRLPEAGLVELPPQVRSDDPIAERFRLLKTALRLRNAEGSLARVCTKNADYVVENEDFSHGRSRAFATDRLCLQ